MRTGTKFGLAAFALAAGTAALWFYFARQVSLPEDLTGFVVAFLAAAALGVTAYFKGTGWVGAVPPAAAIVISSFLTFTIAMSAQSVDAAIAMSAQSVDAEQAIAVGDVIPGFAALDDEGEVFDSKALHGHLVLIKFFRAHW